MQHRAVARSKTLGGQTYWEVEILGGSWGGSRVIQGMENQDYALKISSSFS